jgi:transglutaminase/protease-like cytokinesis protein 3
MLKWQLFKCFSKLNGCDCNYINANFKTDKIRAVFYWTASNISYDVPGMFDLNVNETVPEKIKALKGEKRSLCSLCCRFYDLAQKGNSVLYYRRVHQTVRKVSSLAHAWTAAKINNKWYVFDPTWGAGYVNNGFFKKLNNSYFR